MDSRALLTLLSSLISQLTLLLLLLFPTSDPPPPLTDQTLFPLIHHFTSTSQIIISLLSVSRKRKRTQQQQQTDSQLFRVNSFIPKNPDSFKLYFRMNSSTFEWLSALLEPLLDCRDPIGSPLNLPPETRLGIGLSRLATGSDYAEISNRFKVSEPIAKFCVKQLCRVLCTNFRFWISFPDPNELETVSSSFETLTGLPNCCGVINCSRFKTLIQCNDEISEETIAAQIVVDSSSRILSIVAGYNGNKSDSTVLMSSTLYNDVEIGDLLNSPPIDIENVSIPQYLIGDGEYPLLPWLIVPFVDPISGSCEENYNAAHRIMCRPALRAIASLKNWGVLKNRTIEADLKSVVACIGACSILHNALLMREDYSALCDEFGDYSSCDRGSFCYGDVDLEESCIKKGLEIRSALSTRIRDFSSMLDHAMDQSS